MSMTAALEHDDVSRAKATLRKGTHSCWECKRRKMKCIPSDQGVKECRACYKRGSACVSQEVPEDVAIEIGKKRKRSAVNDEPASAAIRSSQPTRSKYLAFYRSTAHAAKVPEQSAPVTGSLGRNQKLSEFLHQALPCKTDMQTMREACPPPQVIHAFEVMTTPYTSLVADHLERREVLFDNPGPDAHPVLLARHMLIIASFLQHMDEHMYPGFSNLTEKPASISERLADLAVNLVTTKDELLGSLEGLECILLEAVYHANAGNVRRSWLAGRRAVSIGQLMGLNRHSTSSHFKSLEAKQDTDAQVMWFRVVFLDRSLSLMLGLSQACTDYDLSGLALLEGDAPCNRLEQMHCAIAAQILDRNQRPPNVEDLAMTQRLDLELQRAVKDLPSEWWMMPQPTDIAGICVGTRRIFAQVLHYNLLNQLHLPFLLRATWNQQDCTYSRMTCMHASREVVVRYIAVRQFNKVATSCRIIDFLALMAAMTLILAYLDSDPSEAGNILAHTYHSDRAIIEQVQKGMSKPKRERNILSARCAELLDRLLAIDPSKTNDQQDDDNVVSLHVPYFGIIEIAGNGVRLVETSGRAVSIGQHKVEAIQETLGLTLPPMSSIEALLGSPSYLFDNTAPAQSPYNTPWTADSSSPGHTAGGTSWIFQGIDLAFFDNVTRGAY